MSIKIDTSYFSLKCKPSLLHPLKQKQHVSIDKFDLDSIDWKFRFLQEFSELDRSLKKFHMSVFDRIKKYCSQLSESKDDQASEFNQILQMMQQIKGCLQKCQYYNITFSSNDLFSNEWGLYKLYEYPQQIKISALITELQRSLKSMDMNSNIFDQVQKFPFITQLQEVAVFQIGNILKQLKQNMFIASNQLFQNLLFQLKISYDQNLTLKANLLKDTKFNNKQNHKLFYKILIYKECSSLEGLCNYLTYTKNILLDRKSGALSTDHDTWVNIYEACLRIYSRNEQVRQKQWLQIDQILSTTVNDDQFSSFLLKQNIQKISLASINFYIKNLSKNQQKRILPVVQAKINNLIDSEQVWTHAEDIVQHLDNQCENHTKQVIFNRIIKLIDTIFLNENYLENSHVKLVDVEIGLSFFIQSMCKNLQITENIFSKKNIGLICQVLKVSSQNQTKIDLVYHIFTQFIICSYEQSDELSSYLEEHQQIITQIFPQIIRQFAVHNYSLPKQFYKLIFHSVSNIQILSPHIWRGIAQLYFIQSFEETIDMEIFHTQNQAKKKIADSIIEMLKEIAINNGKQQIQLAQSFHKKTKSKQNLLNFLSFKSFKDETIFNNILIMSTFFGQYLPLIEISPFLTQFYSPLVSDVKWKSMQHQNLTLMSYVCQQLPIDVLKATYKFLKEGFPIDWECLSNLSMTFWYGYFSSEAQQKIKAIQQQNQLSFQQYENLHSLKQLDLVLNMINCVFDKLNEQSQKSIKQLRIMYEWGIQYIQRLQPIIFPILVECASNKFVEISNTFDVQTVEAFDLCSRTKNISVLDLHLHSKYHFLETFNDFNKIGYVIESQKSMSISVLMYPCFINKENNLNLSKQEFSENSILINILETYALVQNSCLQEIINEDHLNKVSEIHLKTQKYLKKANHVLETLKNIFSNEKKGVNQVSQKFIEKPLFKRLISHLKLLIGKIYIPFIFKLAFNDKQDYVQDSKKQKVLEAKFTLIKSAVQLISTFDLSFEEHFAELMQVIEQSAQCEGKASNSEIGSYCLKSSIIIKTLEMFFKCVLSNIKVRSYHIFKLIKLFLKYTDIGIQQINQVIKFYIDLFFSQFIQKQNYGTFNFQIKEKSKINANTDSRVVILTPHKHKDHLSFADKVLSPLKKQKISLQQLKLKRSLKSTLTPQKQENKENNHHLYEIQSQISPELNKLIVHEHNLNVVQCSCTLSMFINLFARLNYASLPAGVQHILSKDSDKLVYLDYLINLTKKLSTQVKIQNVSTRDFQILGVDVYGNLSSVLKGKISQQIMKKFVQLSKKVLKLSLPAQNVINLPIKLLNERIFSRSSSIKKQSLQTLLSQMTQISQIIQEFEEEPLAFDLSLKSHILKISPFISSNLHVCNLEYIVGQNKSSISKKIMETNYKLIQNTMGRTLAKQLIKKYQKSQVKKQNLMIKISSSALSQVHKFMIKFIQSYEKMAQLNQNSTTMLYFYFKKLCYLLFYAPQLLTYVLKTKITVNNRQTTVLQVIMESIELSLHLFCQFYLVCLKINSGFCSKDVLSQILKDQRKGNNQIDKKIEKLNERIPLNLVIQIVIKTKLLQKVKQCNYSNLNILRALTFTIKQSQLFRFRFYKFIRISSFQNEDFLKYIDDYVIKQLLKLINSQELGNNSSSIFINKLQLMDLCLEDLLSNTMFDYAKMKLDEKLKQAFTSSQYSLKCLKSFNNCEINTLKILEQAEEEKSVSSNEEIQNHQIEIQNLETEIIISPNQNNFEGLAIQNKTNSNFVDCFEMIDDCLYQTFNNQSSSKATFSTGLSNIIEFTLDTEPLSVKETSQLKQWLSLSNTKQENKKFNDILLKEMQKNCQKLIGKQNFAFNYEDSLYLNNNANGDQIQIAAFALSQNNNSSDCCIGEPSFDNGHDQAMIIQSSDALEINSQGQILPQQNQNDGICESDNSFDGIIQQDQDSQSGDEGNCIQVSIVEQTHVNRLKNFENQFGDEIIEMEDGNNLNEQSQNYQEQNNEPNNGTDGSIQFTSSIKTLDNIEDIEIQQVSQQIEALDNDEHICITVNNQPRQYNYTIDNFTQNQPSRNQINNNSSLVDTISAEIILSNEPVTKQSIITLIEEYTLNPEVFKIIKIKLKKISNSSLKKIHLLTHGELRQQIERQMRSRGLYVTLSTSSCQTYNEGSLFSISKLVNQTFQIDQSKFYLNNFKKCDKKFQQKGKIQQIPLLTFDQWTQFVYLYITKHRGSCQSKEALKTSKTLLQMKNLNELLSKLLLKKQNVLVFLETLLNLISLKKTQEVLEFFSNHIQSFDFCSKQNNFELLDLTNIVLNELMSKLIINRIGLPVLFKGKWNYQGKKLIRYQFQCLISDSNLNSSKNQGEPLLQVFLRKSIQLVYYLQQNNQSTKSNNQTFIKSLTDYFRNVSNFQTNDYPYYFIQDTVKLCHNTKHNNLFNFNQPKTYYSHKSSNSLNQCLLNAMQQSSLNSLNQYEDIFHLMNYLDFQTFSQFLELLIEKHKPLCQKILDKQLNIIKRFRKSIHTESFNKQKLAELYWHQRKSQKASISTDSQEKQIQFFAKIISMFSSSIFQKFKQSIFKYGYGKEQNKRKQKNSYLNKLLMNSNYQNKHKSIKEEITQNQKDYLIWKTVKTTQILKQDILPIIQKITSSFNGCLKKWEHLFDELEEIFGTQRQQKFILFKQCSQFYKIFLSFQMLLAEQENLLLRSMSSLKTKPSLQSTRQMGITGRRRSSLKLPRVSLIATCPTTFKQVLKSVGPRFSFFSEMIEQNCPQLKIHAKYSSLESKLKCLHQKNKNGQMTIEVRRQSMWQDTIPFLNEQFAEKNIKIKIGQQIGLDYGGIRREWITLIVKQLVNPNLGLFQLSVNGLSFQPSSLSYLVPNHLYHFHKFGILVGKALKQNWLLEINFTKSFLKHLLGFTLYVQDLQDIDPETTKSLLWILNNDVGDGELGVDFTHQIQVLGKKQTIQLIQNGKQIFVNDENKKEYVKKLASFKMTEQIREQAKSFMNGVQKVIPYEILKLFSYKQLGIYLAGMPTVDVEQMRKFTRYEGFSVQHQTIKWFWQVLATYTEQQKANFLFFLTGSYKVPYGGFKQNPISINKMPASKDYLPVAHTCFSVIDLPEYTSKQKLALLLEKSIKEGKGFSVS